MGLYERLQKEIHGQISPEIQAIAKLTKQLEDAGYNERLLREIPSEISPEIQAMAELTKQLEDMDSENRPWSPWKKPYVGCENRPWEQPFTPKSIKEVVENVVDQMREGDAQTPVSATPDNQQEVDPTDLPEELDAANMAFRAVLNGYGNPADTFKNRLIDYLKSTYPEFLPSTVWRIATVANPDKARGRPAKNKE